MLLTLLCNTVCGEFYLVFAAGEIDSCEPLRLLVEQMHDKAFEFHSQIAVVQSYSNLKVKKFASEFSMRGQRIVKLRANTPRRAPAVSVRITQHPGASNPSGILNTIYQNSFNSSQMTILGLSLNCQ